MKNQRATQKTLSNERRTKLELIGFCFSNTQKDRSNKIWDSYYEKLKEYVERHGNCRPTKRDTREERALQHWVSMQRQNCKRGLLSDERREKLNRLGMVWEIKATYKPRTSSDDKTWKQGYEQLLEFYKVHSHVNGEWGAVLPPWLVAHPT